ncbi:50S ribosomal protein L9 [Patescibacteria group bacterium]|nr:50S ribosomal protein L9 [Patescibacteria group bacterium]
MRIILLQDIEHVGKKFEVKEVADGYARNHLIPNKLAQLATKKTLQWAEMQKEVVNQKAEEGLKTTQELASQLDGLEVPILVKVGDEGQLFESIGVQGIVEHLKEMGITIKKEQVQFEEPIKELGEFPVKVTLEHNLEAEIRVIITEEQ